MFKLNADIPFRYEWYIFGIINFLNGSEIKICSLLCKLVLFWITPTIMDLRGLEGGYGV